MVDVDDLIFLLDLVHLSPVEVLIPILICIMFSSIIAHFVGIIEFLLIGTFHLIIKVVVRLLFTFQSHDIANYEA